MLLDRRPGPKHASMSSGICTRHLSKQQDIPRISRTRHHLITFTRQISSSCSSSSSFLTTHAKPHTELSTCPHYRSLGIKLRRNAANQLSTTYRHQRTGRIELRTTMTSIYGLPTTSNNRQKPEQRAGQACNKMPHRD